MPHVPPALLRYPALPWQFLLRGKLPTQIDSIYRDRLQPQRVIDFRAAIRDGVIPLTPESLTRAHLVKLVKLGFDLSPAFVEACLGADALHVVSSPVP